MRLYLKYTPKTTLALNWAAVLYYYKADVNEHHIFSNITEISQESLE